MEIVKATNSQEAARKASDAINEALGELSVGIPTLLLLSAGSSLEASSRNRYLGSWAATLPSQCSTNASVKT